MTRGEKVCEFITTYCHVPEGPKVGQPIELADFQIDFIKAIYDSDPQVRRAYLAIARKNGKTALIACLLLAHLVGPEAQPNTQIVSGARSRDQAALVFDIACKIINFSPTLRDIVRIVPSSKRLYGLNRNVEYKALAAEGKTAHGLSPVLAILDEVGQVRGPQDEFVDAITTSQGAHENPLLIAISTQAPTDNDLFSIWLDDAKNSGDARIVSHVYAADEGAALDDEDAWKAANPALGTFRSCEDMRDQAAQALRMPSSEQTFRNLCLNQRVSTVSPFVSKNIWMAGLDNLPAPDPDALTFGGLDLSSKTDLTAFVLTQDQDGLWPVWAWFWTPEKGLYDRARTDRVPYDQWVQEGWIRTTPGATVDYEHVARDILEIIEDYEIAGIAFDRWRIDVLKKEFMELGAEPPLIEFGQGFKDMSPALDNLEGHLLNERIQHDGNPVLTMCMANAVITKDPAGNRKLDKHKATGRIDGAVALAMAQGQAAKSEDTRAPVSPWEDPNFTIMG